MKHSLRILTLLCTVCLLFSIGGAYAAWQYAEGPVDPFIGSFMPSLSEFIWSSEEILPDDETAGESHLFLLNEILFNSKAGLNSKKDALENNVIANGMLHSSQTVQGTNLRHLFTTDESWALDFIIHAHSEKEFHLYTYEDADATSQTVNGKPILVYKTILELTADEWVSKGTIIGKSIVRYNEGLYYYGILPSEWQPGFASSVA